MSWKVVRTFSDAQDGYYLYKAGDAFPRCGKTVNVQRLEELSGEKNAAGCALIQAIPEEAPKPTSRAAKSKRKG